MLHQKGLTLVELLIVLVVTSVLLTQAVPALNGVITSLRLTTAANDFISALHTARSQAVRSNTVTVLCPAGQDGACDEDGEFSQGWLVTGDASDPSATHRLWSAPGPEIQVNFPQDGLARFSGDGIPRQAGGGFLAGTAVFCLNGQSRRVILSRNGRIRTVTTEC
ncbi:GspH/FimT family pseudopilin [Alkalilimnicola ehrlichii MLHE-1]|uniref:Type II secretion system protein H n=1 Tax=Alkalilimnicola ehrlichii (strain ATCC BAA-1101 / DSM 17681 / MLHE-1) TaxID=187272 RepID=Q0AAC7_ALKEH|nr:GspH/FimT family pseudopilin [Alkalilimnicola ehrlichii]ABI56210.1 pilus assembly protein [Alkalilimnicola ehrlichii MLHE-1]